MRNDPLLKQNQQRTLTKVGQLVRWIAVSTTVGMLLSCGQKGPLYLPKADGAAIALSTSA
jgi:predicted small lipoprotein YifL